MTITVIWKLRVPLESILNSFNVLTITKHSEHDKGSYSNLVVVLVCPQWGANDNKVGLPLRQVAPHAGVPQTCLVVGLRKEVFGSKNGIQHFRRHKFQIDRLFFLKLQSPNSLSEIIRFQKTWGKGLHDFLDWKS